MKRKIKWNVLAAGGLLAAFALWTFAVCTIDVQPIGPEGSMVGFARINGFIHNLIGVHFTLYTLTDWLGLIPVGVMVSFALLGLVQWIKGKYIKTVDPSLLFLGGFYIVMTAAYVLFEYVVINRRPVLIDGYLEASYPSSTTLLCVCVMVSAKLQLKPRIHNRFMNRMVCITISGFTAFMVIGRLLSGVHWFTDIVGGILLSAGLIFLYRPFYALNQARK